MLQKLFSGQLVTMKAAETSGLLVSFLFMKGGRELKPPIYYEFMI